MYANLMAVVNHSAPEGSTAFAMSGFAHASPAALCALAVDPARLCAMDPRLKEARWLDDGPPAPAVAHVAADVRLSHEWMTRAVGEQRGIVRLLAYDPGSELVYLCENLHGAALVHARFEEAVAGCEVQVSGWIMPRRPAIRQGMRMLRPLVLVLSERALRRTLGRACAYLAVDSAPVSTG